MGNNLSSTFEPDTSKDILDGPDLAADMRLAIIWAGALYGFAMIFSTFTLVDRWRGPADKIPTSLGSVLAAMLLSTAWPVVMAYVTLNR